MIPESEIVDPVEILANELQCEHGYWQEHPEYTAEDWMYDVSNGDTRRGYWQWCASKALEEEA